MSPLPFHRSFRRAFSLTEILVVVAVIGVLTAIAIPVYSNVTESAKNVQADDFAETLNKSVRNYAQAAWEIPTAGDNSATTDEFIVIRSLQYKWPATSMKPGSPFFSQLYNPTASSSSTQYRIRWNGKIFESLRPGTSGTGLLVPFDRSDYATTPYSFPDGYQPAGAL